MSTEVKVKRILAPSQVYSRFLRCNLVPKPAQNAHLLNVSRHSARQYFVFSAAEEVRIVIWKESVLRILVISDVCCIC